MHSEHGRAEPGGSRGRAGPRRIDGLVEEALCMIRSSPDGMTRWDMQASLGISNAEMSNLMARLEEVGRITLSGPWRGGNYANVTFTYDEPGRIDGLVEEALGMIRKSPGGMTARDLQESLDVSGSEIQDLMAGIKTARGIVRADAYRGGKFQGVVFLYDESARMKTRGRQSKAAPRDIGRQGRAGGADPGRIDGLVEEALRIIRAGSGGVTARDLQGSLGASGSEMQDLMARIKTARGIVRADAYRDGKFAGVAFSYSGRH